MKKIAIYGAGGFGRETRLLIDQINLAKPKWKFIGYFDDNSKEEVLGGMEELNSYKESLHVVVAIAEPEIRKTVVESIKNSNISFAILIHPSVVYDKNEVVIGEGSIVAALSVFTTNITIGNHNIINLSSTVGHDVYTADYCSLMPGVHISGTVNLGKGVLVGSGAIVLQNLLIDAWSKVGAGAVVIENVNPNTTVVGIPAKPVIK